MKRDARLSLCGKFRYFLSRTWDDERAPLLFVMLNPSTADAEQDDPTIRKCIGFSQRLGYGGIEVMNLYAYRATKPADLKAAHYPVGEHNDEFILGRSVRVRDLWREKTVICGWGANARGLSRPGEVLRKLREHGMTPMGLSFTADGIPCHPLMLPYSCAPLEIPA